MNKWGIFVNFTKYMNKKLWVSEYYLWISQNNVCWLFYFNNILIYLLNKYFILVTCKQGCSAKNSLTQLDSKKYKI